MSLNCLLCQKLQRVDSDQELPEVENPQPLPQTQPRPRRPKNERSWSGNLAPRLPYNKAGPESAMQRSKSGRLMLHSGPMTYGESPRLVRSCGMRRDWSFENLKAHRAH
ncbi:hypothetical protein NMG60_11030116 [Bertholletia excelsa]